MTLDSQQLDKRLALLEQGVKDVVVQLRSDIAQLRAAITKALEQIAALSRDNQTDIRLLQDRLSKLEIQVLLADRNGVPVKDEVKAIKAEAHEREQRISSLEHTIKIYRWVGLGLGGTLLAYLSQALLEGLFR